MDGGGTIDTWHKFHSPYFAPNTMTCAVELPWVFSLAMRQIHSSQENLTIDLTALHSLRRNAHAALANPQTAPPHLPKRIPLYAFTSIWQVLT
jgi:hypothetical protein